MRIRYLFIVAALGLCLYACKKDRSVTFSASIAGRWYQNKLIINQQTIKTGATASPTYTAKDFDTAFYWQFNKDNTAFVSSGPTVFTVSGKSYPLNGNGQIMGSKVYYRSYTITGSALLLPTIYFTCNGCPQPPPDTVEIVQLDAHNLVLHQQIDTSDVYKVSTDTYYMRSL